MRWCITCILPDSRPGVIIELDGQCLACKNSVIKHNKIDWNQREEAFRVLVSNVKKYTQRFDCIIPVSGGKDSTWQVIKCLEFGLRPLAVTWKTPARTAIGQRNLDNLVRLGVDHVDWQVNPQVEKKFLLKSFSRFGSTAIPMHMALVNIPLMMAVNYRIPLVIWGENAAFEYGSGGDSDLMGHRLNGSWLKKFGVTHGTAAADWCDDELSESDLSSYFGPTDTELDSRNINAIFLGHYFKWDVETSLKISKENGFEANLLPRTGIYNYADIDDDFISIHHWLKWLKFGITRSFDNLSIEIREGRRSRSECIEFITKLGEERPSNDIKKFCNFTGIIEEEFYNIAERFRNKDIWYKDDGLWKIRDFLITNWDWA